MMTRLNVFMDYNEKGDQIQQQKKSIWRKICTVSIALNHFPLTLIPLPCHSQP